jgi:hypothetical protein
MIRPWFRSRLFWLGIPGLLFLLWAWAKSNVTEATTYLGTGCGWASSGYGKVMWFSVETVGDELIGLDLRNGCASQGADAFFSSSPSLVVPRFHTSFTSPLVPAPPWFPAPGGRSERLPTGSSYRLLSLPYWLVTGLYAGGWLAGLVGSQRRKVRPPVLDRRFVMGCLGLSLEVLAILQIDRKASTDRPVAIPCRFWQLSHPLARHARSVAASPSFPAKAPKHDMIRPWYRSRLFWVGFPGLAMLLWLWLERPMRHFEVKAMWGNRAWHVADSSRLLEVGWDRRSSPYIPSKVEIYRWQRSEDRLFPPALWLSAYGDKLEWDRRWFVAWWLLIAGYIPLWLCGVAWWQRRKRRLLNASAAGSAGSWPAEALERPPARS